MKRSAAHYAVLSPLLDTALALDDAARASWLAQLPENHAGYRPALDRILAIDDESARRRLGLLESRLRSVIRALQNPRRRIDPPSYCRGDDD